MQMRIWIGCAALALAACDQAAEPGAETRSGVLTLALTGIDSQGTDYRLRNANFQVSGYPDYYYSSPPRAGSGSGDGGTTIDYYLENLSSETDPDAPTIVARLVPGYYSIGLLNSDWYLERTTASGTERVEQVVLLSPVYQGAYVWDGGVARVNYRFGVDGELIDFRSGELQIGIEVERPGDNCVPGDSDGGYGYAGYSGSSYPEGCGAGGSPGPAGRGGSPGPAGAGGIAGGAF